MGKVIYRICHDCKKGHNPQVGPCECHKRQRRFFNAQVAANEAAAVAVHPVTGETVYCFTDPNGDMPEQYRREGFVKQQFHSARELEKFCRERGLVNDIEYGNKHDGAFEYSQKVKAEREEERREKMAEYQRARERAMREMGLKK